LAIINIQLEKTQISTRMPGDIISWSNQPISWLIVLLDSRLEYQSLEPLVNFLAFLVPKLWPKKTNCLEKPEDFPH